MGEYLELGAKIADAFFDNSRVFGVQTHGGAEKKDEEEARIRALNEKEERRVQEEKEKWLMAEEERLSEYEAKMKVNSADVVSKENQVPDEQPNTSKSSRSYTCRSRVVGPGRRKLRCKSFRMVTRVSVYEPWSSFPRVRLCVNTWVKSSQIWLRRLE